MKSCLWLAYYFYWFLSTKNKFTKIRLIKKYDVYCIEHIFFSPVDTLRT